MLRNIFSNMNIKKIMREILRVENIKIYQCTSKMEFIVIYLFIFISEMLSKFFKHAKYEKLKK